MRSTPANDVPQPPRTAAQLLALVRAFGPAAEGEALVLAADPPVDLVAALSVLHTGVRARLCGRRWFGSTAADGGRPRVIELDPAACIPDRIGLLTVEGDRGWDRIHPAARIDHPGLFEPGGGRRGSFRSPVKQPPIREQSGTQVQFVLSHEDRA